MAYSLTSNMTPKSSDPMTGIDHDVSRTGTEQSFLMGNFRTVFRLIRDQPLGLDCVRKLTKNRIGFGGSIILDLHMKHWTSSDDYFSRISISPVRINVECRNKNVASIHKRIGIR
jgi:hypothetical protein